MTSRYPVFVDLAGRDCLVVGGGEVATRKVLGLLASGARVRVVAPTVAAPLAELVGSRRIEWREAPYAGLGRPNDERTWWFVVAATSDPVVNETVVIDAERAGIWANHASSAHGGPAALPAVAHEGSIAVAVSTDGAHPAAARWLCDRAIDAIGAAPATALALLDQVRAEDRAAGGPGHRPDWRQVVDSGTLDLIREGQLAEAKERLQACLSSSSD